MLAEASRKDSKWAPYFSVLPQSLDSLVFWSESELLQLQASMVTQKIGKAKAEDMFTKHIAPLGIENANIPMCHHAASVIMAYAFDIPEIIVKDTEATNHDEEADELVSDNGEDERTILSMVPLADMLNADADRNNARLCCDNEDLEMRAIQAISKGDEIFNDYGQLPRSDLLRRYGYITDNYAPYDVVELPIDNILSFFGSTDLLRKEKLPLEPLDAASIEQRVELAKREGVYEDSYDLVHPGPDGPSIPDELLALLYLFILDDENFAAIETSETSLPSRSKLSAICVGQVLIQLFHLRGLDYKTTLEEDDILLRDQNLSHREKMAIQVRRGEKEILRQASREAATFTASDKRMRIQYGSQMVEASGTKRKSQRPDNDERKIKKKR